MQSVLEFLKETEELMQYKNYNKDIFITPSVKRLSEDRERLKDYFNKNAEDSQGVYMLLVRANASALQLEKHLSRIDDKYSKIYEDRCYASKLYNSITKLVKDMNYNKVELTDFDTVNLAVIVGFVKNYYIASQFYVWHIKDSDRQKIKEAESFMEVYNVNNSRVACDNSISGSVI